MVELWGISLNPRVVLSVLFVLGILFRLFIRADKAFRSPLRAYPSRWAFVVNNWNVFLIRTILVNMWLFIAWLYHPDWATWVLLKLNVPPSIANWTPIAPNLVSAPNFGLWVDVLLDQAQVRIAPLLPSWVPNVLKGEIPCYDTLTVDVSKVEDKRGTGGQ